MKWFDNWFAKKSKQSWEEAQKQHYATVTPSVNSGLISTYGGLSSNGLNLTIYKADGGTIVEFRHYDPVKDRNNNSLHVIRDDVDFSQRLSEIITMELMRNGMN
jgi:hypothetical protein